MAFQTPTNSGNTAGGTPLLLAGGTVLNVYSGELLPADVLIEGERIRYVGPDPNPGENADVLDVSGRVLVPGYIDPHFHPWFVYNPLSFAEAACPLGATTLFCDNLIFYLLLGVDRFETLMDALTGMPVRFFWFCRAVPQSPMAGEEELFSSGNLERLLGNPHVRSLGEITRWPDVVKGNPRIVEAIRIAKRLGRRVDGHTAGAKYDPLNALSEAGIESCHESIRVEEVLDRLRLGLYVILRQSSLRRDLAELLRAVTEQGVSTDRLMLTTDCSAPDYYREFGILDHLLDIALKQGVDPIRAYRMVTLNPAVYFGLDHAVGGIAPGRYADINVLKDLRHPTPETVIAKGRVTARNGRLVRAFPRTDWQSFFPAGSFSRRTWRADGSVFHIPVSGNTVRFPALHLVNAVITKVEWVEFAVSNGILDLHGKDEYGFVSLVDREGRWVSTGVIQGFGSLQGMASSFNTAVQILALGRDPEAMSAAVNRVLQMEGGIVAVENGKIAYEFPLPLGGMMSDQPMEKIARKDRELKKFLRTRGHPFHDPLYTLIFLPNDFLPQARVNAGGVVDIRKNEVLWPPRTLPA